MAGARKSSAQQRTKRAPAKGGSAKFAYDPATMRIVILISDDSYLMREFTRQIADALREQFGEIEEFSYDGESAVLANVLDELRSYGLIQRHKLVILDNADAFLKDKGDDDEGDQDEAHSTVNHRRAMERYAESPVDHATLLMRASTWRPGKLDKAVAKVGMVHKATAPSAAGAVTWAIARCSKRYECELAQDAAALLVSQIGTDLGRLDSEIGKLAAYVGPGGTIERAVVGEMVGLSREEKVWAIQSEIASGRPDRALLKLRELISVSRANEVLITWAIMDLMRKVHGAGQLLRQGVQPFQITKQLKLWGDSQGPVLVAAKRLSPEKAADLLDRAVRTDQHNKSGVGEPVRSLEALTLEIADTIGGR